MLNGAREAVGEIVILEKLEQLRFRVFRQMKRGEFCGA